MARRKKKSEPVEADWITTYSDMVTLLLCFFVILYSFSSVNAQKFQEFTAAIKRGFGTGESGFFDAAAMKPIPSIGSTTPTQSNNKTDSRTNEMIFNEVLEYIRDNKMEAKVKIMKERRGIVIELKENVLFDSGRAEIKKDSIPVLDKIANLLKKFPNDVIVEGHTDNLPIHSGYYQSNWELSTDRSVKVVRYLAGYPGLEGSRFSAVGCGEFRPIASNATVDGRQKNRRVNILIVSTEKESNGND